MTMYHNPRCSKSRATLELLQGRDVEVTLRLYLEDPPSAEELTGVSRQLGLEPSAFLRFNEGVARDLGLAASDDRSAEEWCRVMSENPILIERPIVIAGKRAVIGRPPENVLKLL